MLFRSNLLAGISSAIAAIPEEPPVLLAVILGLGAYRLLRRGVLVRRLNAEETLGAVDLIVTDKTGTITQNRLEVASVRVLPPGAGSTGPGADGGGSSPEGVVLDSPLRRRLLEEALRAEEDAWAEEGAAGSFTRALRIAVDEVYGRRELDPADLIEASPATDAFPVSRTSARHEGRVEGLALGAPEAVLGLVEDGAEAEPEIGRAHV